MLAKQITYKTFLFPLLFLLSSNFTFAQEAEDPKLSAEWKRNIHMGFSLTDGNSETTLFNLGAKAERELNSNIWRFEASHSVGETDSETNVDNTKGLLEYKRLLTDRFYVGFATDYLRDEISDIRYRVTPFPHAGYFFIKDSTMTFRAEAGPAYVFEEVGGVEDDYLAPRIGQRFEYVFSKTAKFFEEADITFDINDGDNYIIKAAAGLETSVTEVVSLILSATNIYDNLPAAASERNDLTFLTSLSYNF